MLFKCKNSLNITYLRYFEKLQSKFEIDMYSNALNFQQFN